MESTNSFTQGMNQDFNPMAQPEQTYLEARNMLNLDDIFSLGNEAGNILSTLLPTGYKIIGHSVLDNDIIVFLTNDISSEIGYVRDDVYYSYVNDPALNFSTLHPMDCQSRKVFNSNRVCYFTDDYNPPRYVNLDKAYTNADDLALFTSFDIPVITVTGVVDGGFLTVGAYHFAARYVASDGNTTAFGFVTEVTPIVDENETVIRKLYDGAVFGTGSNKAINLTVSNIDTDFSFIDIAVVKYEGAGTVPIVEVFTRRNISGDTLSLTYRGSEEIIEEATLEDLSEATGIYARAKCIEQKDNRLFLSNLEGISIDHAYFQNIANNIRLKWKIEEIPYDESDRLDYKNPLRTYDKKGYRRSEVYSFAIGFIYKNGYKTPMYHIPGYDSALVPSDGLIEPAAAGFLGTFYSAEVYPSGAGYPIGRVRHHVMPTLVDEPHFVAAPAPVIRILGVELDSVAFLGTLPPDVTGVFFGRQQRDGVDKRVVAQGICHTTAYYDDDSIESFGGEDYQHRQYWNLAPLNGNVRIINDFVTPGGFQMGLFDVTNGGARFDADYYNGDLSPEFYQPADGIDMVGFFSPETVILKENINPNRIKRELLMSGPSSIVDSYKGRINLELAIGLVEENTGPKVNLYNNYTSYNTVFTAKEYEVEDSTYVGRSNGGINTFDLTNQYFFGFAMTGFPGAATDPFFAFGSNDYLVLGLNNDFEDYSLPGANVITLNDDYDTIPNVFDYTITASDVTDERYLYNAYRDNPSQYGAVTNAQYVLTYSNIDISTITGIEFFSGDTFITKFAYHNACNVRLLLYGPWLLFDNQDRLTYDIDHPDDPSYIEGARFRNLNYYFVESDINCDFRHRPYDEASATFGVDYWPHASSVNDILNGPAPSQGHSTGYNLQYSLDNAAVVYSTLPLGYEEVLDYPNRTIYSDLSFEGQVTDSYRRFLVNSYHDIPKNKGEIWDSFVYNNIFYLHTTDSLWVTSVNDREVLQGADNTVYLGSGGLFPVPSREMLTIAGGYAGTQSQWGGVTTPSGYFFTDAKRKKVYIIREGLQEISATGLRKYFIDNLNVSVDNPVINRGLIATWDNRNNRVLLTNHDDNYTISYSVLTNKWISLHDYVPTWWISKPNDLYSQDEYNLYKHHVGKYGEFYGVEYDSAIKFVQAEQPLLTKTFDNMVFYTESTKIDTRNNYVKVRDNTFHKMRVFNTKQNTGLVDLIFTAPDFYDVNVRYVEGKYQVVIPRNKIDKDLLTQDSTDVIDYPHMDTTWEDRIFDLYAITELIYDNKDNYKFVVTSIRTLWRASVR